MSLFKTEIWASVHGLTLEADSPMKQAVISARIDRPGSSGEVKVITRINKAQALELAAAFTELAAHLTD